MSHLARPLLRAAVRRPAARTPTISRLQCPNQPRSPPPIPHTLPSRAASTSSNNFNSQNGAPDLSPPFEKKRPARSTTSKTLRQAAKVSERRAAPSSPTLLTTSYCTAEKYNIPLAASLLRPNYILDPTNTGLQDQALHIVTTACPNGEAFLFPSGNIVAWNLPASVVSSIAATIGPAAVNPYPAPVETEDLEYVLGEQRRSRIAGDVIILGGAADPLDLTLAKIAFSSGLARSTKLAVLETLLDDYLETTSAIPKLLSKGSKLPYTRGFILRKTGELLEFRAQLNLYSELTDSLPDLFWDSRHELGLEGYYDGVGRALDVDVRIRQLNQKLDYASGIVEVLRERLSERHGLGLEWMIIVLIAVEVGFEVRRIWREYMEEHTEVEQWKRWRERRECEDDKEWRKWKEWQELRRRKEEEMARSEQK